MRPATTCVLFPGLDAALGTPKIRRWLAAPDVVAALDEASAHLSELSGRPEDLLTFLAQTERPHLVDLDRLMVALAAQQAGIAREVSRRTRFEILTGCSHGDLARLVISESITLRQMVEFVWLTAALRQRCPAGMTANVRPVAGHLTPEQWDWLATQPLTLSRWSGRHATAAGSREAIDDLAGQAPALNLKVRHLLPYPIHSPLILPLMDDCRKVLDRWQIQPPKFRIVSSVYARSISEPGVIKQEAMDGATSAIRWTETMAVLMRDFAVNRFIIIGPNATMTSWMTASDGFESVDVVDAWDL